MTFTTDHNINTINITLKSLNDDNVCLSVFFHHATMRHPHSSEQHDVLNVVN